MPKRILDASFLNPFIVATMETLKIQCFTECNPQKPQLKSNFQSGMSVDIAGIIGIKSDTFHGSIALCFSGATFLKIMSKMLQENFSQLTQELEDGAAELLNIILGQAEKRLNENGHNIEKALPIFVTGAEKTNVRTFSKGLLSVCIVLPFLSNSGDFFLEISAASQAVEFLCIVNRSAISK